MHINVRSLQYVNYPAKMQRVSACGPARMYVGLCVCSDCHLCCCWCLKKESLQKSTKKDDVLFEFNVN